VTDASATETLPRTGTACPACGAPADEGQLVCLECGTRLALDYRRPSGWKPAAAIVAVVLLIAGAAFAITLIAVDDDAEDEVADTRAGRERPATRERATADRRGSERRERRRESAPTRAGISSWPATRNGFTVVLLSAGDEATARNVARNVRADGVDVGVLRSDDYSSLAPGFWIVFSGVYGTREQAERAASRLGTRYSGAFPQFVNGAERG
jgi:SPOR domain